MHTQKVAITMPEFLVREIDTLSKKKGISRSRYITLVVRQSIEEEKQRYITECYNNVFSEKEIQEEQLETVRNFEGASSQGGQEW